MRSLKVYRKRCGSSSCPLPMWSTPHSQSWLQKTATCARPWALCSSDSAACRWGPLTGSQLSSKTFTAWIFVWWMPRANCWGRAATWRPWWRSSALLRPRRQPPGPTRRSEKTLSAGTLATCPWSGSPKPPGWRWWRTRRWWQSKTPWPSGSSIIPVRPRWPTKTVWLRWRSSRPAR